LEISPKKIVKAAETRLKEITVLEKLTFSETSSNGGALISNALFDALSLPKKEEVTVVSTAPINGGGYFETHYRNASRRRLAISESIHDDEEEEEEEQEWRQLHIPDLQSSPSKRRYAKKTSSTASPIRKSNNRRSKSSDGSNSSLNLSSSQSLPTVGKETDNNSAPVSEDEYDPSFAKRQKPPRSSASHKRKFVDISSDGELKEEFEEVERKKPRKRTFYVTEPPEKKVSLYKQMQSVIGISSFTDGISLLPSSPRTRRKKLSLSTSAPHTDSQQDTDLAETKMDIDDPSNGGTVIENQGQFDPSLGVVAGGGYFTDIVADSRVPQASQLLLANGLAPDASMHLYQSFGSQSNPITFDDDDKLKEKEKEKEMKVDEEEERKRAAYLEEMDELVSHNFTDVLNSDSS